MPSANESAYGGIADSYATKYGIPTDMFRSYINSRSGFDPFYTGTKGEGIAGVVNNSNNSAINSFDINQQLDFAAQGISKDYAKTGSWTDAFKANGEAIDGSGDYSEDTPGYDALGNPTGVTQGDTTANTNTGNTAGGFFDTIKTYFTKYVYSAIIFIVGLLLILATVYIVVIRGSGEK